MLDIYACQFTCYHSTCQEIKRKLSESSLSNIFSNEFVGLVVQVLLKGETVKSHLVYSSVFWRVCPKINEILWAQHVLRMMIKECEKSAFYIPMSRCHLANRTSSKPTYYWLGSFTEAGTVICLAFLIASTGCWWVSFDHGYFRILPRTATAESLFYHV